METIFTLDTTVIIEETPTEYIFIYDYEYEENFHLLRPNVIMILIETFVIEDFTDEENNGIYFDIQSEQSDEYYMDDLNINEE